MTRFDRRSRVALTLWITWAVVVWNVSFDRVIESAGRAYLHAAALAAQSGGPYARIEDWMGSGGGYRPVDGLCGRWRHSRDRRRGRGGRVTPVAFSHVERELRKAEV